ncbi:helix-turn-helix domain-containing protein [Brevundimonas sp. GW460-12-10-14-LB2]|uniref:helix-turn-helix domain-containing protein n=1 Tax=Brevundimonas sp. GW460-12-10-14-LB2 TaxID=1827469 RepID=UPI000A95A567|nr:helix-turn-helix transcriptional regulator [Brevundimonas sp. GW460-12-10-14-LB2]
MIRARRHNRVIRRRGRRAIMGPTLNSHAKLSLDAQSERQRWHPRTANELVRVGLADADPLEISRLDVRRNLHTGEGMLSTYSLARSKVCAERNDSRLRQAHNVWMEHNYLRAWRKFRHMTLDEVAAAIDSTKAVVQQLEVGRMSLSHKWLVKIAPVLGTTPGMLLDHDPNDLPTSVLETWAAIPAEDQPTALRVLESFKRTGTND